MLVHDYQDYAVQIHYLEGKRNIFADTLSRLPDTSNTTKNITKQFQDDFNDRIKLCKVLNNCTVDTLQEYIPAKMPWEESELRNAQQKDSSCIQILKQHKNTNDTRAPPSILLNCRVVKERCMYYIKKLK